MSILKVARMGHPVLVARAEPVAPADLDDPAFQTLVDDMIDTMRDAPGVGLAAPQVHVPRRFFVMDPGPGAAGDVGLTVVVNPELEPRGADTMRLWEGCLSIPGIRGMTERSAAVRLRFLDRTGRERTLDLEGFPAAVAQHEFDHLDGRFFLSRMPDPRCLAFEDEYLRWWSGAGEDGDVDEESDGDEEVGGEEI